jgi:hypothetical protein
MKATYPKFEPLTDSRKKPFLVVLEVFWHTVIPVLLTYCMVHFESLVFFLPVVVIMFVRLNFDESRR